MVKWLEMFPVPEESPAHLARLLLFSIGKHDDVPEKFYEYTPWFTNVMRAGLSGDSDLPLLRIPPFWRLPWFDCNLSDRQNECDHSSADSRYYCAAVEGVKLADVLCSGNEISPRRNRNTVVPENLVLKNLFS